MFNPYYTTQGIASDAVYSFSMCPSLSSVVVEFKKGGKYLYQNVDQDALMDALFDGIDSLGSFVNEYCKVDGVNCHQLA